MKILGIASPGPNTAACLISRDTILAAIEEEKLTRANEQHALPQLSIASVFSAAGLDVSDVDSIAVADRGARHGRRKDAVREASFAQLRQILSGRRFARFDHHLCHAASAYYTSDFPRSLILTLDHGLHAKSGLLALGEDDQIKSFHSLAFPNSQGWFYSRATQLAGLRPQRDEHKLQWLSKDSVGNSENENRDHPHDGMRESFREIFEKLFSWNAKGLPVFDRKYFSAGADGAGVFSPRFYRELGLSRTSAPTDPAVRSALARSAQALLEEIVLRLVENFRESTGTDSLSLAGGVFQNVLLVRALEQRSGFRNVYVQPVPGNAGTSLGAAFLAQKKVTGKSGRSALHSLALGPEPTSHEIKAVLDNCKIVYRYPSGEDQLLADTVHQLDRGKIVAWCQGRTEFGHRALGNRSILASPFNEYVLDNVNQFIKHREEFHPFALSVPAERAAEFFDCGPNCRFMASLGNLKNSIAGLERFTFNGTAVRVHTVEREANPLYWKLLHKFGETAPAPILVNTSFNLFGEPLVTDPRSAVRSFYCSGIDALAVGPFLIVK
jgi:carbamoyltransferase